MDASISDILASVTRSHHAATTFDAAGAQSLDAEQQREDLQLLTRAWVSERVAPELLPYPTDLMERTMRRIREQIEAIEDRTARMDAGTSFALVIIQTELERFKFMVRSFLRARIAKIDAHPLHILSVFQSQPQSDSSPLLSPQESQYLTTHAALLERHYNASFLSSFPAKLRRLDDRAGAGGVGMVEGPDLDKAVFVRCLGVPNVNALEARRRRRQLYDFDDEMRENGDDEEDERYGDVEVSCGFTRNFSKETAAENQESEGGATQNTQDDPGERFVRMQRGDIWLVRWSAVRDAVAKGECELV